MHPKKAKEKTPTTNWSSEKAWVEIGKMSQMFSTDIDMFLGIGSGYQMTGKAYFLCGIQAI